MKELFKAFQRAEERTNEIDRRWEAEPENEELEKLWDAAYEEEYKAHEAIVNEIVKITDGKIDAKTAKSMLHNKRSELETLAARMV